MTFIASHSIAVLFALIMGFFQAAPAPAFQPCMDEKKEINFLLSVVFNKGKRYNKIPSMILVRAGFGDLK